MLYLNLQVLCDVDSMASQHSVNSNHPPAHINPVARQIVFDLALQVALHYPTLTPGR